MKIRDYKDLIIWQKSIDYAVEIYRLTRPFPVDERYGVTTQIRRAAISISSNIAEGYGRATPRDYLNFLSHSRGSLKETESLIYLTDRLGFLSLRDAELAVKLADEISRMNATMRTRLQAKLKTP